MSNHNKSFCFVGHVLGVPPTYRHRPRRVVQSGLGQEHLAQNKALRP
jgi:hypothetical protein